MKVREAQQILENSLLEALLDEYAEGQIASWIHCDDWRKRGEYHAKVNAMVDIKNFLTNKAKEIIDNGSEAA